MSKILVFIRQEKGFCCTKYQVCADEGSFTLDLLAMGGDPTMAFSAEGKFFYKSNLNPIRTGVFLGQSWSGAEVGLI